MEIVIAGCGEVGEAMAEVLSDRNSVYMHDPIKGYVFTTTGHIDVLLIAFPYSEDFITSVEDYQNAFKPEITIILSTVPIGTSRKLGAFHSPIEGRHNNMVESIRGHRRWIGGVKHKIKAIHLFFNAGIEEVYYVSSPEITEFLKLQSLAIYGINIEWARYCGEASKSLGANYNLVIAYNQDYNNLIKSVHKDDSLIRYNLVPPNGKIGGHCVLQNTPFLNDHFPHGFIKEMLRLNQSEEKPKDE